MHCVRRSRTSSIYRILLSHSRSRAFRGGFRDNKLISTLPAFKPRPSSLLDVGCSRSTTGRAVLQLFLTALCWHLSDAKVAHRTCTPSASSSYRNLQPAVAGVSLVLRSSPSRPFEQSRRFPVGHPGYRGLRRDLWMYPTKAWIAR